MGQTASVSPKICLSLEDWPITTNSDALQFFEKCKFREVFQNENTETPMLQSANKRDKVWQGPNIEGRVYFS